MVRDGLVFKDEDGQVIFNQYSFCELVKHLLVELVGISYEDASQIVECSPLAVPRRWYSCSENRYHMPPNRFLYRSVLSFLPF